MSGESSRRRVFASIDALHKSVGEKVGTSAWLSVDQELVDRFAEVTGDHQWIHVDVERASASSFGGTLAHGFLTLSLLPRFGQALYDMQAGSARLNYGLGKVRFPAPLKVGSRIRATATIAEVRPVTAGTQVRMSWLVEAEGVASPVCVAEVLTLVIP